MKKLTGALVGLSFLLCAFSVQAASEINISVPSVGEACTSSEDCAEGEDCINAICIPSAAEPCSSDLDCTLGGSCVDDVCVPSVGDPCSNDLDCGPDGACIDEICVPSAGDPCSSNLDCGDGEVCIDEICVEGECETDADCDDGLLCNENTFTCVECFIDSDCEEGFVCDNRGFVPVYTCVECLSITNCDTGEYCTEDDMCEPADDCDTRIRPKRVKISKMQKKNEKRSEENKKPFKVDAFKISGNENFDPNGAVDAGLIDESATVDYEIKKKSIKMILQPSVELDLDFYPISVGSCIVELEVY